VTAAARVFFVGGLISYRALFNWIRPGLYVTTMLGSPLFQILFFTYLGRFAGSQDDDFYIVGNSVQVAAMAGIYGMTMRALPFIANGLFVSTFGFLISRLLLDFSPEAADVPALAFVVLVTTCSCTALGMVIGSIGLRARDVFFAANLVYFLMLLVCGVNIAEDDLPGWMQAIGSVVPLTHGIEAARDVVAGEPLSDVVGLVALEALIGLVYATVAYGLFRFFEAEGRRRASLETF
jgi:ABC-2 type transport system permease protein